MIATHVVIYTHSQCYVLSPTRGGGGSVVAVSSSPRPWMDLFDLLEKSNIAVTESDPDPKIRKMSITFYWLCDLWAEHASMELKC